MTERATYDAASLRQILDTLEARHGMTSEKFMAAHKADDDELLRGISGFGRHTWAGFYSEWRGLTA